MENKAYELRNPQADDIFLMFRIFNKIGIKNIRECFQSEEVKSAMLVMAANKEEGEKALSGIGMVVAIDIGCVLMEHMDAAKNDIYAFLGRLSGMKAEDIAKMNPGDFAEMIADVVKLEGFRDFFMRVFGLFK